MHNVLFVLVLLFLVSCTSTRKAERQFYANLQTGIATSPVFSKSHTGFYLMDAATGQTLAAVNADGYFTPASNTKILTLATCLKVLGDSIPGVQRIKLRNYPLTYIRGTGDPTFLNPYFNAWQSIYKLIESDTARLNYRGMVDPRLGPGWAWDDAAESYSAERSQFPMYGGLIRITAVTEDSLTIYPDIFDHALREFSEPYHETLVSDPCFTPKLVPLKKPYSVGTEYAFPIPYATIMAPSMLTDTIIHQDEYVIGTYGDDGYGYFDAESEGYKWQTFYSCPVDTVYRRMMYESDNFVAEQLLLVCSGVKFDTLQQGKIIAWAKDSLFATLHNPPRWVDGSGLSRYNLITPRYLAGVLQQLYREQPRDRLFSLFLAGGMSGTVAGWYRGPDGKPFVFAKGGSMSGVQCLSGYLLTKRGKVLVFSFMHNNFVGSGKPWKAEMQRLLLEIRDKL